MYEQWQPVLIDPLNDGGPYGRIRYQITIGGSRRNEWICHNGGYVLNERSGQYFQRRFLLPADSIVTGITYSYTDFSLIVTVPRAVTRFLPTAILPHRVPPPVPPPVPPNPVTLKPRTSSAGSSAEATMPGPSTSRYATAISWKR